MPGLIETQMGGTTQKKVGDADVFEANAVGYDPAQRTVDASKETVKGQMDSLLANDSSYITRARTRAAQTANARGLINSSIAAGAGEAAAIDAALPIASQDASIYDMAARENMAAKNRALEFGASESNLTSRFNADSANQLSRMTHGANLEKGLIEAREGAESRLSAQQSAQQQALAQLQGEIEKGLIKSREEADARLRELTGQIESQLSAQQAAQQQALAQVQGEIEAGLITTREQADARLRELQGQIEAGLIEQRGAIETALQNLRGQQAMDLAQIEASYKSLIQASSSAQEAFKTTQQAIAAIQSDPNTSQQQKTQAVQKLTQMLQLDLTIIGAIGNIDLAGLIDFSDIAGATA